MITVSLWTLIDDEPETLRDAGAHAFQCGEPLASCEYKPGTPEHNEWAAGWRQAGQHRMRTTPGLHTFGSHQPEMARDLGIRPDPAAEILGLEPERREAYVRIVVDAQGIRDAGIAFTVFQRAVLDAAKTFNMPLDKAWCSVRLEVTAASCKILGSGRRTMTGRR